MAKIAMRTIADQKTMNAKIAASAARSWEIAKIQEVWRNVSDLVRRPPYR